MTPRFYADGHDGHLAPIVIGRIEGYPCGCRTVERPNGIDTTWCPAHSQADTALATVREIAARLRTWRPT